MQKSNQIHCPRSKYKDRLGNDRNRLWLKSGNTTMLLTCGITKSAATVLEEKITNFLKACGLKREIDFLLTK